MAKKVVKPAGRGRAPKVEEKKIVRRRSAATVEKEPDPEPEPEPEGDYAGEGDFYVSDSWLGQHQAVVCFSQLHGGNTGVAIMGILENIVPNGSVQQLIVDHANKEEKFYTLLLAVN